MREMLGMTMHKKMMMILRRVMWAFITAGVLYLLGVAAVLLIKPTFMFTPDGQWKEFGIGQNPDRYTAFPFWLFCLTWALVSYILILLLLPLFGKRTSNVEEPFIRPLQNRGRRVVEEEMDLDEMFSAPGSEGVSLPKGFYALNKKATRLTGMPKYVYIGENPPDT